MNLSSRGHRLPLIIATVLIVYSHSGAQEPIRVAVGNPDCSAYNVPAEGDVAFPVWVDFPYPVGVGSMVFIIVDSVVTEWLGINFLYPWQYNYDIFGDTLRLWFFTPSNYPYSLFHLADIIFAIEAGPPHYGDTIQAITVGDLGFSDTTGYIIYPDSFCVSALWVENPTEVEDPAPLPDKFTHTAYPNPFNASVTISLNLPREGNLNLAIYDITGRIVRRLFDGRGSGEMQVIWDGADEKGVEVASGVYFYRMEFEGGVCSSKVTLLR